MHRTLHTYRMHPWILQTSSWLEWQTLFFARMPMSCETCDIHASILATQTYPSQTAFTARQIKINTWCRHPATFTPCRMMSCTVLELWKPCAKKFQMSKLFYGN